MCTVYCKSRLKGVFVEGQHLSIRFSMRSYWDAIQEATIQNLVRYATSLSKLREGTISNGIASHVDKQSRQKPVRKIIRNAARQP